MLQTRLGFLNAIKTLEDTNDNEAYLTFVQEYGTHFLKTTNIGARYTEETEITTENQDNLEGNNINIKLAASYSAIASLGINTLNEEEREMAEKFVHITIIHS